MSYNISDINKLKSQIKQYYSFIKNDGIILTNFAKYLLSKTDMNLEQAISSLKEMSIKDIQSKLYDLTLELNTQTEISDIIKNKIDEENKKFNDKILEKNKIETEIDELIKIQKDIQEELDIMEISKKEYIEKIETEIKNKEISNIKITDKLELDIKELGNKKIDLNNDLSLLKNTIDGIYKNKIYDEEYTFEESKYVKKEPCIHLDVDKILEDLKNGCCEINNICNKDFVFQIDRHREQSNYTHPYDHTNLKIYFNFPITQIFLDNEYIIKIYHITNTIIEKEWHGYHNAEKVMDPKINKIVYLTNYGRIIKTDEIMDKILFGHNRTGNYQHGFIHKIPKDNFIIVKDNKLTYNYFELYQQRSEYWNDNAQNYIPALTYAYLEYNLAQQPKLNYRIPRLFIDVIDAFHTQNTDLMQECCKKYLEISRESKIKDSILKDLELNNKLKEKDNIIKSKDLELEYKNKVIESQQEEINKLKDELTKFKQSLSMLINK